MLVVQSVVVYRAVGTAAALFGVSMFPFTENPCFIYSLMSILVVKSSDYPLNLSRNASLYMQMILFDNVRENIY